MDRDQRSALIKTLTKFAIFAVGVCGLVLVCTLLLVRGLGLDAKTAKGDSEAKKSQLPERSALPSTALKVPGEESSASATPAESETPKGLKLETPSQQVAPSDQIHLSGAYPDEPNATLQIQRKEQGGDWEDFPVTAKVQNGTFKTYILTSRTGEQQFRVTDTANDVNSNAVTVTVG